MSSILTSIQIYSEGFCLASKTKIYEYCLVNKTKERQYCLVRKTISAYDKVKKVDVYESRYFETNNN